MPTKKKSTPFTTVDACRRLQVSLQSAIDNMIDELSTPPDSEASGSSRKAELQSITITATDAVKLIKQYDDLSKMIKSLEEDGELPDDTSSFSGGFAENFSS